jgi:hypothetical protein
VRIEHADLVKTIRMTAWMIVNSSPLIPGR